MDEQARHQPTPADHVPGVGDMIQQTTIPTPADVDDRVGLWHDGRCPAGWSLADALGMTDAEYAAWVRNPAAVPARPLPEVPRHG